MSPGTRRTAAALALVAAVVAALVVTLRTDDGDDQAIVVTDGDGDCREPGRDFGAGCDAGADARSIGVSLDGGSLTIAVELAGPPPLRDDAAWRIQVNVAATDGRVCGMSNVVDEGAPGTSVASYGFDPDFGLDPLTRRPLEPGLCETTLDGTRVELVIDVVGQDPAEEIRIAGFTRLEFLDDPDQPGSEDDFGLRISLDQLG